MDLSVTNESFGDAKMSWLGSRHGVTNARTVTIDRSKVTADQKNKGFIPAGTPLTKSGDKYAPYTGAGKLEGFLLTNQKLRAGSDADVIAPLLDHGRIIVANLPVQFTVPDDAPSFIFV